MKLYIKILLVSCVMIFGSSYIVSINKHKSAPMPQGTHMDKTSCCGLGYTSLKRDHAKHLNGGREESVVFYSQEHALSERMIERKGILIHRPGAKATILICHGYTCNKYDATFLRLLFTNYNVMIFDFRAHGECIDGQVCSFGRDEAYDVIGAVKFLRSYKALSNKPIIAYGFSMGAVSSIIAQSMQPLFDAAIWDCPIDSSDELISRSIDKLKAPAYIKNILKKNAYRPRVQEFIKFWLRAITNLDATKIHTMMVPLSGIDAIHNVSIPILIIGCDHDEKIPVSAVTKLYESAQSSYKRLWITGGRRHFDSLFNGPEEYAYKINRFIDKVVNHRLKKDSHKIVGVDVKKIEKK